MQKMPKRSGRKVRNSSESRFRDSPISLCVVIGERTGEILKVADGMS
jgi:hypothetical protein